VLWANLHLLFWLSLLPVSTGWMGENHFAALPTATYGIVLFCAAVAYWILQQAIIAAAGPASKLRAAIGSDWKGKASPVLYLSAIGLSFWWPSAAQVIYVGVALIWLIPDRRIESTLASRGERDASSPAATGPAPTRPGPAAPGR